MCIRDSTYTGEKIIPQVTLIDGSTLLLKDKDYTVYHGGDQDNIQVGEGFVTITGSGNYRGEITKRFELSLIHILPRIL